MQLTVLLDTLTHGGSGPWSPNVVDTSTATAFESIVTRLIPCREHDAELWFAESAAEVELAKSLCQGCPLREGCLAGAIERAEPWGVWGGEVFVAGEVVARKRGRGRPRKDEAAGTGAQPAA